MSSIQVSTSFIGRFKERRGSDPTRFAGDLGCRVPGPFARLNYRLCQLIGRSVFSVTMNVKVIRPEAAEREGGYVLAITHLSHLDPVCVGAIVRRKIDWMARLEFYRFRLISAFLWSVDAFPVNRFGVAARSIRSAIARAGAGRVIGIFPEGGVSGGQESVCRGGPIKKGACVVAQRAGVPIIPCVIIGTHRLNHPLPWIPYRRGNLWVIFGDPVEPRAGTPRRVARLEMGEELRGRLMSLYRQLRATYPIPDEEVP